MSTARTAHGFFLRIHHLADFFVDLSTLAIQCKPTTSAMTDDVLEALLFDQVIPQVLHLSGRFSFHASAVAIHCTKVVGFLGNSGSGKSTLAGYLGQSHPIVSDDCLTVSTENADPVVYPAHPSVRLFDDSMNTVLQGPPATIGFVPYSQKTRIELCAPSQDTVLMAMFILSPCNEDQPRIEMLSKREAFVALSENVHRIDPDDRNLNQKEFDFLCHVTERVRVARLFYGHSYLQLPAIAKLVIQFIQ